MQRTINVRQRRWVRTRRTVIKIYDRSWGTGGRKRHICGRIACEEVRVNDVQIFSGGDAHALQIARGA